MDACTRGRTCKKGDPCTLHVAKESTEPGFNVTSESAQLKSYSGVHASFASPCACDCGARIWLSANLVHKTGCLPVLVRVTHYGDGTRNWNLSANQPRLRNVGIVRTRRRWLRSAEDAMGTRFWKKVSAKASWIGVVARLWKDKYQKQGGFTCA